MIRFLTIASIMVAVALTAPLSQAGDAEAKPCKAGKVLDPDTGKCVTPRGS